MGHQAKWRPEKDQLLMLVGIGEDGGKVNVFTISNVGDGRTVCVEGSRSRDSYVEIMSVEGG